MDSVLLRLALLAAITAGLAQPLGAQESQVFKLGARYNDFAIDPDTGHVAAIDPKAGTVELYRSGFFDGDATAKSEPLKVGNLPSAILYKKFKQRGVFAIACHDDKNLHLIDAAKFELLRKVPLEKLGTARLACTVDPADPYVYYSQKNDHRSSLGRVNLAKLQDEGEVLPGAFDFALSARGNAVYSESDFYGFSYQQKTETTGKPVFDVLHSSHQHRGVAVPDTREVVVAIGDEIRTADLSKSLARMGYPVLAFHPQLPLLFGLQGETLCVSSANTFQSLAKHTLPRLPPPPRVKGRRFDDEEEPERDFYHEDVRYRARVLADDKNKRLIVLSENLGYAVPLAVLKLPEEPWMRVEVPATVELAVGASAKLPLVKADPRVEVSIIGAVDNVTLIKDAIEAKPSASDVGEHSLILLLKHGALEVTQTVTLRVSHAHVKLPFRPSLFAADATGAKVVCAEGFTERFDRPEPKGVTRLAVIDTATRQVIRTLSAPLRATAIATDGVSMFVSDPYDQSIVIIPLGEGKARTLPFRHPVQSMSIVPGKLLYIDCGNNQARRFDWKENNWVAQPSADDDEEHRFHSDGPPVNEAPRPLAGGWNMDGLVYDQQLAKIRLIHRLSGVSKPQIQRIDRDHDQFPPLLSAWSHPSVAPERRHWQAEGALPEYELQSLPARVTGAVEIKHQQRDEDSLRAATVQLVLRDLTQSGDRQTILLAKDLPVNDRQDQRQGPGPQFRVARDKALLMFDDRLFIHDLSTIDAKLYPPPLSIALDQSALALDMKQTTRLTHKISAPKGKWTAQLVDKPAYLTIDRATAEVTVDGPALAAHYNQELLKDFTLDQPQFREAIALENDGLPYFLSEMRQRGGAEYQRLTGQKPQGLAYAVPIRLQVTASDGSDEAKLEYLVLADIPLDEVQQQLAAAQRKQAEAVAKRRAQAEATSPAGQDRRLTLLEDRMKAIEAKLDRLTELLIQEKRADPKRAEPQPE